MQLCLQIDITVKFWKITTMLYILMQNIEEANTEIIY